MKNIKAALLFFITSISIPALAQTPAQQLKAIFNANAKQILIAAHRGDWRSAPENSVQALQNSIAKGFDLMELDVKLSKDSVLVVMHDNTLDRSTNGKGKPSDYTLVELKKMRLKNGLGRTTDHQIPTLEEMMKIAKGKILINVDKGNLYLPQVFSVLKSTGTTDQTIVNVTDNTPYDKLRATNIIPSDAYIMVVVGMTKPDALQVIKSYQGHAKSVIQPIFDTDTLANLNELPKIAAQQVIWLNSLWPSLNGGHDDDRAVEKNEKEASWGWLIQKKPTIIQTDRPEELLKYLRARKLHP
ncbi:MAG: glycerophosphodiester phosphodiesterase family protein [Bacteroidota bacterium]